MLILVQHQSQVNHLHETLPLSPREHLKRHKEYSRQDTWDVKDFSTQVWQVAEHEDQQRFDSGDVVGESSHEGWNKPEDNTKQHATQTHNEEASKASEDINGFNLFVLVHLGEGDEDVVQHLCAKWGDDSCQASFRSLQTYSFDTCIYARMCARYCFRQISKVILKSQMAHNTSQTRCFPWQMAKKWRVGWWLCKKSKTLRDQM